MTKRKSKIKLWRTHYRWLLVAMLFFAIALLGYLAWSKIIELPVWIIITIAVAIILFVVFVGHVRIKAKPIIKKIARC